MASFSSVLVPCGGGRERERELLSRWTWTGRVEMWVVSWEEEDDTVLGLSGRELSSEVELGFLVLE